MDKISINIKNEEEEEEEENEYGDYFDECRVFEDKELNDHINHTLWVDSLEKKKLIYKDFPEKRYKTKIKATGQIIVSKIYYQPLHDTLRYFKRELIILSQISHPFIAKFIGCSPFDFEHRPNPIIFLEYCKNGSIRDIIELEKKGKKIEAWNSTTKLINVYGIASAMSYLHSLNIVHRNLTPRNVLLDEFLHPKLSSFEIAKFSTDETGGNDISGSPAYVAPEIWEGMNYTKSSDVYAFGMLLYATFTGKEPFKKINKEQIAFFVTIKKRRPEINNSIPTAIQELIESCWGGDPKERPTFDEILDNLENNQEFITDEVDANLYHSFIKIAKESGKEVDIENEQSKSFSKYEGESIQDQYQSMKKEEEKEFKREALNTLKTLDINFMNYDDFEKDDDEDEPVGFGSYGKVFKIKHKKTKKIYAAKILNSEKTTQTNFEKEIRILSHSKHPLIVRIVGYSKDKKSNPIIITEFIENGSLREILEKELSFQKYQIIDELMQLIIIYGIATAMNYLHKNSIIHLDIKPDNVLVNRYFFPIVCDFGISEEVRSDQPIKAGFRGTVRYCSPELLNEETPSEKSDVYSFGMLLYEIKTRKIPFESFRIEQVMCSVLYQNLRPELNRNKLIPKAYKELIQICWDREPKKRPTFEMIIKYLIDNIDRLIGEDHNKELFRSFVSIINEEEKGIDQTEVKQKFLKPPLSSICERIENQYSHGTDYYDYYDDDDDNKETESNMEQVEEMHIDSYSSTYKCVDKKTKNIYSVTFSKIPINEHSRKEITKIRKESKELSEINHPSIQHFISTRFKKQKHKIKLAIFNEYFPYKSLRDVFSESAKGLNMTPTKKLISIYGISEGLLYLNSHKVEHPTPNPKNILVNENYEPKLSEIGFYTRPQNSRSALTMTSNKQDENDFYYSSPESLKGNHGDQEKSDVYSFSIIAYQILTNELPFEGKQKLQEFIRKVADGIIQPKIRHQIPLKYKCLLGKCFSFDESERPTFSYIVTYLSKEENFITDEIDKTEFERYKKMFDQFHQH